ncbi:YbaB/EbfC family nucleoid-associated protein [Actinosynnema sp. NPDC023794]
MHASADGLVTATVGATFTVTDIEITDNSLDPAHRRRIEAAARDSVNMALHKAALAAGELLTAFDESLRNQAAGSPRLPQT